jgi:hypothetical protein
MVCGGVGQVGSLWRFGDKVCFGDAFVYGGAAAKVLEARICVARLFFAWFMLSFWRGCREC